MATSSVSKSNALKCKGDGSPQHPARLLKARKRSNNGFIDFRVRAEGPDLARLETSSLRSLRSLQDKYKAVFDNGRSLAVARGGSISETVFKKRFEALLKGSIETSGSPKDGPITWMQIVRFAKSNSKDFECEASRDNLHWFQMDGVKVGIAYDDYLVICSGILFRLIAPSSTPCRVDLRNELTYLTKLEKRLEDIPGETQLFLCITKELQEDVDLRIHDIEHELLKEDKDTSAVADEETPTVANEEDHHTSATLEAKEEPSTITAAEADRKGQTKA